MLDRLSNQERAVVAGIVALLIWIAPAAEAATESTALTIYSTAGPGGVPPEIYQPGMLSQYTRAQYRQVIPGYAIIKQEREFTLDAGRSRIRFTDVASQIDPTTVSFASLTDPEGTHVLEQNYEFDLDSTEKLMRRFLDR